MYVWSQSLHKHIDEIHSMKGCEVILTLQNRHIFGALTLVNLEENKTLHCVLFCFYITSIINAPRKGIWGHYYDIFWCTPSSWTLTSAFLYGYFQKKIFFSFSTSIILQIFNLGWMREGKPAFWVCSDELALKENSIYVRKWSLFGLVVFKEMMIYKNSTICSTI